MSYQSILQFLASQGVPLMLGAVGGGIISGLVTWRMLRANTLRQLVADALAIQAEKEAWILEGPSYGNMALSRQKGLSTVPSNTGLWLRRVEVRAVLDEAQWTPLLDQEYDFISGRRAWIVRDSVTGPPAYIGALGRGWHPALASSRALEDLCGWVEQVRVAKNGWLLLKRDLVILKPLLQALCTKDRLDVFGTRLSDKARKFLEDYQKGHV
jgi:hypothetical protein